jgi:hypothetical protein
MLYLLHQVKDKHLKTKEDLTMNNTSTGGVGICTVLFLIFLVLKLTGTITWSWLWVLAPIWIPAALCLIIVIASILIGIIATR